MVAPTIAGPEMASPGPVEPETIPTARTGADAELRWRCLPFDELSPRDLYDALQLRSLVFVVEQTCPFLDADGDDDRAWHLFGTLAGPAGSDGPRLAAYARLFAPGIKYREASIGRVVTHPDARRSGAGRALLTEALRRLDLLEPGTPVRIGAQKYLERFYGAFGFVRASDDYLEDGIVHLEMVRDVR